VRPLGCVAVGAATVNKASPLEIPTSPCQTANAETRDRRTSMAVMLDMPYAAGQISWMLGKDTIACTRPLASTRQRLDTLSATADPVALMKNCARTEKSRSSYPRAAGSSPWNVKECLLSRGAIFSEGAGDCTGRPSKSHSWGWPRYDKGEDRFMGKRSVVDRLQEARCDGPERPLPTSGGY